MRRLVMSSAIALGCATIAVSAQKTKTETETDSSGGPAQVVSYIGCVGSGTDTKTYTLDKVVPVTKTTTVETPDSSTTTSSTSFVLVPGETVHVQESVGKKVEVTGTMIPAGKIRTETKTRTDREDAPDTKTRERSETKNAPAQFRVTSIQTIGSC